MSSRNLLIVGDHNVGKKTLKEYITRKYPDLYNEIFINLENPIKNTKSIVIIVIMFNTEYKSISSKSVKSYIDTMFSLKVPIIICGNKIDLLTDKCYQDEDEFDQLIQKYMIPYVEISLINNDVEKLMSVLRSSPIIK